MITRWTKRSSVEYEARWQADRLSLRWEGDRWRLYVAAPGAPEKKVQQSWHTHQAAMREVDEAQQRIVARLVRENARHLPRGLEVAHA